MRALNKDAEKLLMEAGPDANTDPTLHRLQEDIKECNLIFDDLTSQLEAQGQLVFINSSRIIVESLNEMFVYKPRDQSFNLKSS